MATRLSQNWTYSQRLTESGRTMIIRITHNRRAALERSVIHYLWFKFVLQDHNPRPRFCLHTFRSAWNPSNAPKRPTYKSRFNTEMQQNDYSKERHSLQRWNNKNPTAEHRWARTKTQSNVNSETGPLYQINFRYLFELLMDKCDWPYRQNRYYQYLTGHPNI